MGVVQRIRVYLRQQGQKVLAIVLLESEMQQITPTPEMQQITEQRLPPQIQPKLPQPESQHRL